MKAAITLAATAAFIIFQPACAEDEWTEIEKTNSSVTLQHVNGIQLKIEDLGAIDPSDLQEAVGRALKKYPKKCDNELEIDVENWFRCDDGSSLVITLKAEDSHLFRSSFVCASEESCEPVAEKLQDLR